MSEQRPSGNIAHFQRTLAACGVSVHRGHDVVPVEAGGEVVAHLCVTCDLQLSAGWRP